MKVINARVLGPDFKFYEGGFSVKDGRFVQLFSNDTQADSDLDDTNENILDLSGLTVIPGLIDVHMHGYGGFSCEDPDPRHIREIGKALAKKGVTAYAATIGSSKDEPALKGIRANVEAAAMEKEELTGSRILGIHMEGPFLNMIKKGGMDADCIVAPSLTLLKKYMEAASENVPIKIMTIAPEISGAEEVIRFGTENGVRFSMGHTNADCEETRKGIEWGACRATHTFNAMRALNHREIGVLGESLSNDAIQCEMISDFVHLKKEICMLIYRVKGADKVTVISDSLSLAGLPQDRIPQGTGVEVRDALYLPDGTLCGSIGNVMLGVRNLISIGIPAEDAVKMASINPAKDMDRDGEVGSIDCGKIADFVVVNDKFEVVDVYMSGMKV